MSKYLNLKSDRTFKKVFGEHKELFLTVLNAMQPGCEIKSLEDLPAEIAADSLVAKALSLVEESAYTDAELLAIDKYWDQVSRERTALNACRPANDVSTRYVRTITPNYIKADGSTMSCTDYHQTKMKTACLVVIFNEEIFCCEKILASLNL